jgi:hypothetical protein
MTLPGELFVDGDTYLLVARARRGPPRLETGDIASAAGKLETAVFMSPPFVADRP